jgi:hypothetical protein
MHIEIIFTRGSTTKHPQQSAIWHENKTSLIICTFSLWSHWGILSVSTVWVSCWKIQLVWRQTHFCDKNTQSVWRQTHFCDKKNTQSVWRRTHCCDKNTQSVWRQIHFCDKKIPSQCDVKHIFVIKIPSQCDVKHICVILLKQ